jgi:hypothetical protein
VTPALNTIGFGLNQGWYNTAQSHKLFGFDLTVTGSAIYFPTSELTYKVENSKLTGLQVNVPPATNTSVNAPTIFGSGNAPVYQLIDPTTKIPIPGATTTGPEGQNLSFVPVPMVQLGLGLPKGTDLKFRFTPESKFGDATGSLFGIGLMHDIKQWIPGISKLPFDLSVFGGYTQLKMSIGVDPSLPNNKANLNSTATTIQALISKKLAIVTFYGGLGYNFSTTTMDMKGTYVTGPITPPLIDPINISASQSGPRITAGIRLKLLIFALHADYTIQKYDALTVGFGLNIR